MNFSAIKDSRSHRTRDVIVRAAEQLFAEQGIEAVSINTITRAAGQNNRNAVQYHFGNKAGLLQAIFDKHGPGVAARRAKLVDQLLSEDISPPRLIASAIVNPLLEKMEDEDGGEAFIHISAELITSNTLGYAVPERNTIQLAREGKLAHYAANELTHLPKEVALQRILLVNVLGFHALSDHARVRKNAEFDSMARNTAFMASNLIDSMAAILETTPSTATLDMLTH
jgi:AcrR family transcriptional regulator